MEYSLVDDGKLACSHGLATPLLEPVDAPLHHVALFVHLGVESVRAPARTSSPKTVVDLVGRLRNDSTDPSAAETLPDHPR